MGDMTRLLLLLWAGVSVSSAVDLQKRIIGGQPCKDAERRYHVYVEGVDGTDKSTCGGSLISNQWILTAAHCQKPEIYVYLGQHPGKLNLDESKRMQITEKAEIYRDTNGDHDLMLLKLPEPTDIQPVKLPSKSKCLINPLKVQIAGYGATQMDDDNTNKNEPDRLQCADIQVTFCKSLRTCLKKNQDQTMHNKYHYQDWLCYKSSTQDQSPGDSGGGVVHSGMIYGVIAFSRRDKACSAGAASINVCNSKYQKWIKNVANIP